MCALRDQRLIVALSREIRRARAPQRQARASIIHSFGRPESQSASASAAVSARQRRSSCRAQLEIDRPPVVRVDQTQIPQFGALIEVRNARRDQLDERLRQAVDPAGQYQRLDERLEARDELRRLEHALDEAADVLLVADVRLVPGGA